MPKPLSILILFPLPILLTLTLISANAFTPAPDPTPLLDPGLRQEEEEVSRREKAFSYSGGESEEKPKGKTIVRKGRKIGRNDPCPCGSGKKYKKCCIVSRF